MTAPIATSTQSPDAIAAQLPPRQRASLLQLAAGVQPFISAAGLGPRGLVVHNEQLDILELTPMGRLVAQVLDGAS